MWALMLKKSHLYLKQLLDKTGVLLQYCYYKNIGFDQSNTNGWQKDTWRDSFEHEDLKWDMYSKTLTTCLKFKSYLM